LFPLDTSHSPVTADIYLVTFIDALLWFVAAPHFKERKNQQDADEQNRQLGEPFAAVRQPPTESEKRNRGANGPPEW
jgi:hypothetical protein